MKIEKTSSPAPASKAGETGSRTATARATGNKTGAAENSGTSVHLGTTTAQLHSIEGSIASTPLVDAQKVAEIKQAITEGRFQVNSGVVADRLISTVQELIAASQH
jgi:negative regulator of flagellin synthesis FlgM